MINADEFYEALGTAIKRRREAMNLTQQELGSRLGLSRTSITNIERGRQRLLIDQFCRLADVLRCDRDALLMGATRPMAIEDKLPAEPIPETVAQFVQSLNRENRR